MIESHFSLPLSHILHPCLPLLSLHDGLIKTPDKTFQSQCQAIVPCASPIQKTYCYNNKKVVQMHMNKIRVSRASLNVFQVLICTIYFTTINRAISSSIIFIRTVFM